MGDDIADAELFDASLKLSGERCITGQLPGGGVLGEVEARRCAWSARPAARRSRGRRDRHRKLRRHPALEGRHPRRGLGRRRAALLIGALAGLLPAVRAARLSPTQALWSL